MAISAAQALSDLLDEKEVSEILKISVNTLRNWRALRQGPRYFKVGKRAVRYRRSDIDAFVAGSQA